MKMNEIHHPMMIDETSKLYKEWTAGKNWRAIRWLKRLAFQKRWNNYSKFYLRDLYKVAGTCDKFTEYISMNVLKSIAEQINCEIKMSKDLSSWKRKKAIAKYRIRKYTYFLVNETDGN